MYQAEIRFLNNIVDDKSLVKRVVNVEDGANIATIATTGFQEFDLPLKETLNDDIEPKQLADIVLDDIFEFLAPITNADIMATRLITYRNPYTQSKDPATYGPWYGIHADTPLVKPITDNPPIRASLETVFRFWTRPGVKLDVAKLNDMSNYAVYKWWKNVDSKTDSVWKLIFMDRQTPVPQEYWHTNSVFEGDNYGFNLSDKESMYLPAIALYDHPEVDNYRYYFFPNTSKDQILIWKTHDNRVSNWPPIFHAAGYVYGETNPDRRSIEGNAYCWYL